jgi:hypothetical protein
MKDLMLTKYILTKYATGYLHQDSASIFDFYPEWLIGKAPIFM